MLIVAASLALAAFPERVSVSAMEDYGGEPVVSSTLVQDAWRTVTRDLAVSIANQPVTPGNTPGINGFYVGIHSSATIIYKGYGCSPDEPEPSPWCLATEDEEQPYVLASPGLLLRKGLPGSLEIGGHVGWLAPTQDAYLGGYGKLAVIEGHRRYPDVALQLGYAGLVGNDEIEIGVLDFSGTVGYDLPFGRLVGVNESHFTPFFALGLYRIHAAPRTNLSDSALDASVTEVTAFGSTDARYDPAYGLFQFGGGFRMSGEVFSFTLSGGYAVDTSPTVNVGLGFNY